MSIINDALKKAETEKHLREQRAQIGEHFLAGRTRRNGLNWGPVFVLLVLVLITGPIVAPVFSRPFRSAPIQPMTVASSVAVPGADVELASVSANSSGTRHAQFQIEESPLLKAGAFPPPSMQLTGIVYTPHETSYCIINGQILREGDRLGAVRISKIGTNEVLLDQEGNQIRLSAAQA